jgi:hypothetical protein
MVTLYKTVLGSNEITEIGFDRVSGKSALRVNEFGREERCSLETNYSILHPTRPEAIKHLVFRGEHELLKAAKALERAQKNIDMLRAQYGDDALDNNQSK